jgi:glutathione S-transferase
LDRTKYASRYPDEDPAKHKEDALRFLLELDRQVTEWVFERPTVADFAVLPFVRQFAFIDKTDFDGQELPNVQAWLARFLDSSMFSAIMTKYPQWREGNVATGFP